jgi:protein-disulfide isomerase
MLLALLACVPRAAVAPPPPAAPAAYGPTRPAATITAVADPVNIPADLPSVGPADALVEVVTFSDFQCPYCAHLFPLLVDLTTRRPDIRFRFGSFPLDMDCNPSVSSHMHRYACQASVGAVCADAQGRYVAFASALYANPEQITPPALPFFADRAGLDIVAYGACIADPAATATLAEHVAAAVALDVQGTPTVLVRGLTDAGWVQVGGEATAILAAIEAAPRR